MRGCSSCSSSCCDRGKTKSTLSLKTKPRVWQYYVFLTEYRGRWVKDGEMSLNKVMFS